MVSRNPPIPVFLPLKCQIDPNLSWVVNPSENLRRARDPLLKKCTDAYTQFCTCLQVGGGCPEPRPQAQADNLSSLLLPNVPLTLPHRASCFFTGFPQQFLFSSKQHLFCSHVCHLGGLGGALPAPLGVSWAGVRLGLERPRELGAEVAEGPRAAGPVSVWSLHSLSLACPEHLKHTSPVT